YKPIRHRKRLSRALHGRRPSLCPFSIWHPPNVAATILCGEYRIGTCLGTCSCFSWCAARNGAPIDQRKLRAAYNSRDHRADCCNSHYLCHTLMVQGQVERLTTAGPSGHAIKIQLDYGPIPCHGTHLDNQFLTTRKMAAHLSSAFLCP